MKPNERRAHAIWHRLTWGDPESDYGTIESALDAAERRGEERVLREMKRGVCICNGDDRTPHATRGISCVKQAIKKIRARRARAGRGK